MIVKGRHKSIDKHLKSHILWVEHIPGVQKVVLGISEACRHKYPPGHIRFKSDVDGGIKVNCYSGKGITDVFIKIEPISRREEIKKMIEERFHLH